METKIQPQSEESSQKKIGPRWVRAGQNTHASFEKAMTSAGHHGYVVAEMAIKYPAVEEKADRLANGHHAILSAFIAKQMDESNSRGNVACVLVTFPETKNAYSFLAYRRIDPVSVIENVTKAIISANEALSLVGGKLVPLPPKS